MGALPGTGTVHAQVCRGRRSAMGHMGLTEPALPGAEAPASHHHPTPLPGMGTQSLGTTMWQGTTSDMDTALPSLLAESKGVPGW